MSFAGGPQLTTLADGRRHFNHGPIDLIIECFGDAEEVERAYKQAANAFESVLETLAAELSMLRSPVTRSTENPNGSVARCMLAAVKPHSAVYVTPLAAVAGAVADHVLMALLEGRDMRRAYVNNGGDIALHLGPGESFQTGIVFDVDRPDIDGIAMIESDSPVRGIATSGWSGRSHSMGVADSVTVLATNAARADVAATLIGNATDVDHPSIERVPADELEPDSDLKSTPVTVAVGQLNQGAIDVALEAGVRRANQMLENHLIEGALVSVQGVVRTVGELFVAPVELEH